MAFQSLREFLAMGGQGFYVWTAYLLSLGALFLMHGLVKRRRRQLQKQLSELEHELDSEKK